MENREKALQIIFQSIKDSKDTIGVKTFKWAFDDTTIQKENLPCIFMGTGDDSIINYSNRSYIGYPATRMAQVILELVTRKADNINSMLMKLRTAVLSQNLHSDLGMLRELRTIGPTGYNVPDVKGVSLILGLRYIDNGI